MPNQGPVNMESSSDSPVVEGEGRKVDPDTEETTPDNKDKKPTSEHMTAILEHVPEELKERVQKLQREELSMPGAPRDREAYDAYLGAEKMIRDLHRREVKKNFSFKGLPKQSG